MSDLFRRPAWHDWNNIDMNSIRTQNVTCICSLWSNNSIEGAYDITSGLLPVLSDVKITFSNISHQKIRRKVPGGSFRVFLTHDSILWVLPSILTLMSVFWKIKAQLLTEIFQRSCKEKSRKRSMFNWFTSSCGTSVAFDWTPLKLKCAVKDWIRAKKAHL